MSLGFFLLFIWFVCLDETNQINQTRLSREELVEASVFEGEFRDSGLV
jgi:hypothetical protein